MFALFDKVMVLDKGVCVYFGPTTTAKAYFEKLGFQCEARKSTPDFLTGITNPNERKIMKGFEDQVPKTAAEMEKRYLMSQTHDEMAQELVEYERFLEAEVRLLFLLFLLVLFLTLLIRFKATCKRF